MAARVYRIAGQEVSQKSYLDYRARLAGYASRAERQKAQKAAKKAGVPLPPSKGGRKPVARRAGVWHRISETGRQVRTSSPSRIIKAIHGAAIRKSTVYLDVKADNIVLKYPTKRPPTEAGTGPIDARELWDLIREGGGDERAIEEVFTLLTDFYAEVSDITSYTLREYAS